jgi:hypothetical protein
MRAMLTALTALPLLLSGLSAAPAERPPELSGADRVRLAEGFRLAETLGNKVWPDWDKAPFAVLLVTPEHEFLVGHPKPSDDFQPLGEDGRLKGRVWFRARKFPTNLLATFPAVGGVPTVVIGQPEHTESKTSARWVITLLHEHFHQLQDSQPRFYAEVDALGLARGDMTGMWMLNFPFPYADAAVNARFTATRDALAQALRARRQPDFADKLAAYRQAREAFRDGLQPDDYKYWSFQVWKEGIARYTEYHLAELAGAEYRPGEAFRALPDFQPFSEVAAAILAGIEKDLGSARLDQAKRTVVYNFGAAEGLVLDRARPEWRRRYFTNKFTLDPHFRAGR